jgi:magnesium chelatase family protein
MLRAMEVAAAGGHHPFLLSNSGCGRTLLASRLPGILPAAREVKKLETAQLRQLPGPGSHCQTLSLNLSGDLP